MTIRNPRAFVDQLWDWGCLAGCFGDSKIQVTDIEGMVEHNRHFLIIESKGIGVPVPEGQRILFQKWISRGFSVIFVWGTPGQPERIEYYAFGKQIPEVFDPATLADLRAVVSGWYRRAHGRLA